MANQYYYLIAGLPDIAYDDAKRQLTPLQLREELFANLLKEDIVLVNIYYHKFDNQNVLNMLQKKNQGFNDLGIFSRTEIEDEIKRVKDEGVKPNLPFPEYLQSFIDDYVNDRSEGGSVSVENMLAEKYFQFAIQTNNTFISTYYRFELNILNFLTATYSRKYKLEYENEILGEDEISNQIRKSNARDFNISGEFEFTTQLLQVAELDDIVDREKKLDALRWNYMDNAIFFNYFTIERIFAYMMKIEMIDRWQSISNEKGKEDFEHILNELQSGLDLPEEYLKK